MEGDKLQVKPQSPLIIVDVLRYKAPVDDIPYVCIHASRAAGVCVSIEYATTEPERLKILSDHDPFGIRKRAEARCG